MVLNRNDFCQKGENTQDTIILDWFLLIIFNIIEFILKILKYNVTNVVLLHEMKQH